MPEGDTIHRTADRLRATLAGQPLVKLDIRRRTGATMPPPPGTTIDAVDAVGKHLLVRFGDGTTLRTHMQMNGAWHVYRTGERWRRPRPQARVVIDVDGWSAVCFAAPVVELTRDPSAATAHLGPDLMTATDDDIEVATARLLSWRQPAAEIGAVLLDQRVACGVGNMYKSESLFACGVDPFRPIADLDEDAARHIVAMASRLLRTSAARRDHAVYGREGQLCRRCGTPIRRAPQGAHGRSTYWCPSCQR
jgi:endonuclease-8